MAGRVPGGTAPKHSDGSPVPDPPPPSKGTGGRVPGGTAPKHSDGSPVPDPPPPSKGTGGRVPGGTAPKHSDGSPVVVNPTPPPAPVVVVPETPPPAPVVVVPETPPPAPVVVVPETPPPISYEGIYRGSEWSTGGGNSGSNKGGGNSGSNKGGGNSGSNKGGGNSGSNKGGGNSGSNKGGRTENKPPAIITSDPNKIIEFMVTTPDGSKHTFDSISDRDSFIDDWKIKNPPTTITSTVFTATTPDGKQHEFTSDIQRSLFIDNWKKENTPKEIHGPLQPGSSLGNRQAGPLQVISDNRLLPGNKAYVAPQDLPAFMGYSPKSSDPFGSFLYGAGGSVASIYHDVLGIGTGLTSIAGGKSKEEREKSMHDYYMKNHPGDIIDFGIRQLEYAVTKEEGLRRTLESKYGGTYDNYGYWIGQVGGTAAQFAIPGYGGIKAALTANLKVAPKVIPLIGKIFGKAAKTEEGISIGEKLRFSYFDDSLFRQAGAHLKEPVLSPEFSTSLIRTFVESGKKAGDVLGVVYRGDFKPKGQKSIGNLDEIILKKFKGGDKINVDVTKGEKTIPHKIGQEIISSKTHIIDRIDGGRLPGGFSRKGSQAIDVIKPQTGELQRVVDVAKKRTYIVGEKSETVAEAMATVGKKGFDKYKIDTFKVGEQGPLRTGSETVLFRNISKSMDSKMQFGKHYGRGDISKSKSTKSTSAEIKTNNDVLDNLMGLVKKTGSKTPAKPTGKTAGQKAAGSLRETESSMFIRGEPKAGQGLRGVSIGIQGLKGINEKFGSKENQFGIMRTGVNEGYKFQTEIVVGQKQKDTEGLIPKLEVGQSMRDREDQEPILKTTLREKDKTTDTPITSLITRTTSDEDHIFRFGSKTTQVTDQELTLKQDEFQITPEHIITTVQETTLKAPPEYPFTGIILPPPAGIFGGGAVKKKSQKGKRKKDWLGNVRSKGFAGYHDRGAAIYGNMYSLGKIKRKGDLLETKISESNKKSIMDIL